MMSHQLEVFRDLPVANVFQVVSNVVHHLLGKIFKFWSLHVDLKAVTLKLIQYTNVNQKTKQKPQDGTTQQHRKHFHLFLLTDSFLKLSILMSFERHKEKSKFHK